jgi:flagellar biogenesis protein FliO
MRLLPHFSRVFAAVLVLALSAGPALAIDKPLSNDTILTPSASAAKAGADSTAGKAQGGMTGPAILCVTAILALGAYWLLRRAKNNLSGKLGQSAKGAIDICRVRSLGGKQQYLAVVQVEGKRLLLGIGPGFMTKLADLEAEDFSMPFERKAPPATPAPEPQEAPTYPFSNLITRINESISRKDDGRGGK